MPGTFELTVGWKHGHTRVGWKAADARDSSVSNGCYLIAGVGLGPTDVNARGKACGGSCVMKGYVEVVHKPRDLKLHLVASANTAH